MDRNRFKALAVLIGMTLLLALSALPAVADQPDSISRKILYDCQQKAAEYTYNLDKAGDQDLFNSHVKECLDAKVVKTPGPVTTLVREGSCHPMTFVNNSGEDIFLGVWRDLQGTTAQTGVTPPAGWPDWKIAAGETKKWCADYKFHGRFIARTGCKNGKCDTGDCCSSDNGSGCEQNVCTTGSQPASLAEFTLDDDHNKHWYNASYVDGYNFPVQIDITTTSESKCEKKAGCAELPPCPWGGEFIDGVCNAPYKLFEKKNPDFLKLQPYYVLAAKCASTTKTCGCGNQCTKDKLDVCLDSYSVSGKTLYSAGCSPLALNKGVYDSDAHAQAQVVCVDSSDATKPGGCKFLWDDESKKYPQAIRSTCKGAYTWQYDDAGSLGTCLAAEVTGFTITFGKRPAGANTTMMTLAPDASITGTITVNSKPPILIPGNGSNIFFTIKDKDIVKITDNCGGRGNQARTCTMSYDAQTGLVSDMKRKDCGDTAFSGYNWDTRTPRFQAMGKPGDGACIPGNDGNFTLYAGDQVTGSLENVTSGSNDSFTGPNPKVVTVDDKDSVKLTITCNAGGQLTCPLTYDKDKGFSTTDPACNDDISSTINWTDHKKKPAELHFGAPDTASIKEKKYSNQCK